jgi:hypothetical protein
VYGLSPRNAAVLYQFVVFAEADDIAVVEDKYFCPRA